MALSKLTCSPVPCFLSVKQISQSASVMRCPVNCASFVVFLRIVLLARCCCADEAVRPQDTKDTPRTSTSAAAKSKIAIIGGGIGGTFAARYLAEYDSASCKIDSITIFDPSPQLSQPTGGKGWPGGPPTGGDEQELGTNRQGSRVSSLTLSDRTVVELGASIIFSGNELLSQVVDNDPELERADPLSPGKDKKSRDDAGFGIYNGDGQWPLIIRSGTPDYAVMAKLIYRYGIDLIRVRIAAMKAFKSFTRIYQLLNSTDDEDESSFFRFDSPDDIWQAVGLHEMTTMSFDKYLDHIGVSGGSPNASSWWNSIYESTVSFFLPLFDFIDNWLLPPRGNLRREICESVNINNYNQANGRLNGLAGLVSFLPTQGSVYSVLGGNAQLLSSSFRQAVDIRANSCNARDSIRHVQSSVTSISISDESIDIITDGKVESADHFDVVILAAPLQQCQIKWDKPMKKFPRSASRRYTQTITTIVANGSLQSEHFQISNTSLPRAVSLTEKGKESEDFSCLAELTDDGTFKVFSSKILTEDLQEKMFGKNCTVKYQKQWGGEFGGAYPDFAGGGDASVAAPFLLYGDDVDGPGLYYINAMEAAVAAMEISAIGAKAVSKLVARRLDLFD